MRKHGLVGPLIGIVLAIVGAATGSLWLIAAAVCWTSISLWAVANY